MCQLRLHEAGMKAGASDAGVDAPTMPTLILTLLSCSPSPQLLPAEAPTLVLLPGLTGGSHDSYVAHMALAVARAGIRPVVFNSRGTSDAPVTSAQFYSASFTGDMR